MKASSSSSCSTSGPNGDERQHHTIKAHGLGVAGQPHIQRAMPREHRVDAAGRQMGGTDRLRRQGPSPYVPWTGQTLRSNRSSLGRRARSRDLAAPRHCAVPRCCQTGLRYRLSSAEWSPGPGGLVHHVHGLGLRRLGRSVSPTWRPVPSTMCSGGLLRCI